MNDGEYLFRNHGKQINIGHHFFGGDEKLRSYTKFGWRKQLQENHQERGAPKIFDVLLYSHIKYLPRAYGWYIVL